MQSFGPNPIFEENCNSVHILSLLLEICNVCQKKCKASCSAYFLQFTTSLFWMKLLWEKRNKSCYVRMMSGPSFREEVKGVCGPPQTKYDFYLSVVNRIFETVLLLQKQSLRIDWDPQDYWDPPMFYWNDATQWRWCWWCWTLSAAQLLYHRQYMYDTVKSHLDAWINHYFPKEPEPVPQQPPIYISEETRETIDKDRVSAAIAAAEAEALDEDAGDDETDLEGGTCAAGA